MRFTQFTLALLSGLAIVTAAPVHTEPSTRSVQHHSTLAAIHLYKAAKLSQGAQPGSPATHEAANNEYLGAVHIKEAYVAVKHGLPPLPIPEPNEHHHTIPALAQLAKLRHLDHHAKINHGEAKELIAVAEKHLANARAGLKDPANLENPEKAAMAVAQGARDITEGVTFKVRSHQKALRGDMNQRDAMLLRHDMEEDQRRANDPFNPVIF